MNKFTWLFFKPLNHLIMLLKDPQYFLITLMLWLRKIMTQKYIMTSPWPYKRCQNVKSMYLNFWIDQFW